MQPSVLLEQPNNLLENTSNQASIAFVCIVEAGKLEEQVIRMIESLRRWGGKFANAHVLAVTPRLGSPLTRETLQAFEKLSVDYIYAPFRNGGLYSWNGFLNKPLGLIAAQEKLSAEEIVFLDSDLLFVNEPDQLLLEEGEDFLFCCTDAIGGTTGQGDIQESFWQAACSSVGLNIDDLPWLTTAEEGITIRFYFNSGLMAYRPSSGFAERYLETMLALLNAKIMSQQFGVFFHDQIAAALTVFQMGLNWRNLPQSHNYEISSDVFEKFYREERLKTARIVHYHDCMLPHFWSTFLDCLKETHQPVANWLNPLGAVNEVIPYPRRLPNRILQSIRGRFYNAYIKKCRLV